MVVGPGRIGTGIAQALAMGGCSVVLLDVKDRPGGEEFESLEASRERLRSNIEFMRDQDALEETPGRVMERISLSRDRERTLTEADWVFECLPEEPELKQRFLQSAEPLVGEDTVIASATSTISLNTMADVLEHPGRMLITHWLNPPFIIPLVEVARTDETRDHAVECTIELLESVGKVPVECRDAPGFIGSRIQAAAFNEAVRVYEEGVASAEDIDRAFKAGQGFRLAVLGLIEFVDLGGVDILYYADRYLSKELGERFQPPPSVVEKFEAGNLGPDTGKGYYDYSNVDVDALFRKKYAAFLDLLDAINESDNLNFSL